MSISTEEFKEQVLSAIDGDNLNFALNSIINLANEIAYGSNTSGTVACCPPLFA